MRAELRRVQGRADKGQAALRRRFLSLGSVSLRPFIRVNRAGFTLIELLVAISILAIVAVLGWRGLDGIVRARVALTNDTEQTRGMQLAFAQLESDCAHIAGPSIIFDRAPLSADPGSLLLVRTVFAYDQPTRVQVVAYRLSDGLLTRQESAPTRDLKVLDNAWQAALTGADKAQAVTLQSGVAVMTMRTWANDGAGWRVTGGDAAPAKPAPSAAPIPLTGLEVALQLRDHPGSMIKVFLLGTA